MLSIRPHPRHNNKNGGSRGSKWLFFFFRWILKNCTRHFVKESTQLGLGQGSNDMQRWNIVALMGDTHITEPEQRCVYPFNFLTCWFISCWMKLHHSYLFNTTSDVYNHAGTRTNVYINIAAHEEVNSPETALRLFCLESLLFCCS